MTIMPKFIKENNDLLLSLNLSKEETFTGYYDTYGKKIYRKVIEFGNTSVQKGVGNIAHNIANFKDVVKYDVIASDVQGDTYHFPVTYYSEGTSGTFYSTYFSINREYIHYANNVDWINYSFVATIYYTKH